MRDAPYERLRVGSPYDAQLSVAGGSGGSTWSVTSGSLLAGLSLSSATGVISGTPTAEGSAPFTVQASNAGPPAQTASKALSIAVEPAKTLTTTMTPTVQGPVPVAKSKPSISIETSMLQLAKGKVEVEVEISCKDAACKGTLDLVETVKSEVECKGRKRTKSTTVVLANGSYTLADGKTKTITLKLTAKAGKLLSKKASKQMTPKLTVTVTGGTTTTQRVKLKLG